jgi:uncharacterized protein YfaS (alpha-2-macroglobulin family)
MRKYFDFRVFIVFIICLLNLLKLDAQNTSPYAAEWKEIEQLDSVHNTKSALEKVEALLVRVRKDNAANDLVKAIIFKQRFSMRIKEINIDSVFKSLIAEERAAVFPAKPILQSLIAAAFARYADENRWNGRKRTNTKTDKTDFSTLSFDELMAFASQYYRQSVSFEASKKEPIQKFDALTEGGNNDEVRPTLYDFLMGRALAYFSNESNYLTEPAYKFDLSKPEFFAPADEFVKLKLTSQDTSSNKYFAFRHYQNWLQFHENDVTTAAYVDADLQRLAFIRANSTLQDNRVLYEKALEDLRKKYIKSDVFAHISVILARFILENENFDRKNPDDENRWNRKRAREICIKAKEKFPNAPDAGNLKNIIREIELTNVDFETEQVYTPNRAGLARLTYRNLKTVHFRIVQLSAKEVESIKEDPNLNKTAFLAKLPTIKRWSLEVPDFGDYSEASTEFKIESLPIGTYGVLVSDNPAFKNVGLNDLGDVKFGDEFDAATKAKIKAAIENDEVEELDEATKNKIIKAVGIGKNVSFNVIHVSNLAVLHSGSQNTYRRGTKGAKSAQNGKKEILVTNRTTGEPIKSAVIELWKRNPQDTKEKTWKKINNATTNEDGFAYLAMPKEPQYYERYKFIVWKGKDMLNTDEDFNIYGYGGSEPQNTPPPVCQLFLDRQLYRPSQPIYFKGIVIQNDSNSIPHIVKNQTISVTLRNANYQDVITQEFQTNEYGTFNGVFNAPSTGLTGYMSLQVNNGVTGQVNFRVEEYKRPKFEVTMKPLEGTYKINDEIKATGLARMYAGANLDGATVTYRVVRQVEYPYWGYCYWWRPVPQTPEQQMATGEIKTNNDGTFDIKFKALPDTKIAPNTQPVFVYKIYATVADLNGETHSAEGSVSLGYHNLQLATDDLKDENRATLKKINISTNNLNGQPLDVMLDVKLELLASPPTVFFNRYWNAPDSQIINKKEWKKDLPNFAYGTEDRMENWVVKKIIVKQTLNSKTGKAELDLSKLESGTYRMSVENTGGGTFEKVNLVKYFNVYNFADKVVPYNTTNYVLQVKKQVQPSEKATVLFGTAEPKLNVWVEWEHAGKTVSAEWRTIRGFEEISMPVTEDLRGGLFCHLTTIYRNRVIKTSHYFEIPFSHKDLKVELISFRDKMLPASQEEWKIKISGAGKDRIAAEMMATMYDASLDKLYQKNSWSFSPYPSYPYSSIERSPEGFSSRLGQPLLNEEMNNSDVYQLEYRYLKYDLITSNYRFRGYDDGDGRVYKSRAMVVDGVAGVAPVADSMLESAVVVGYSSLKTTAAAAPPPVQKPAPADLSTVKTRTDLKETVFFYPNLETDAEGNILVKFKMGESLTKWRFLALAHTQDLKIGQLEKEVITQKDLMVFPNPPRFVREGDEMEFSTKISNLTGNILGGSVKLELLDAATLNVVDEWLGNTNPTQNFEVKAAGSTVAMWRLKIPKEKLNGLTWRVVAKSGNFSDGEEATLPVLTNRMLVTETLPMSVRGGTTKNFELKNLTTSNSPSLTHHGLKIEFTSNPVWYAIQAMPYLMEYPHECVEQTFSRYFSNAIAASVVNSQPKIKAVFERWRDNPLALASNLEKNQELKAALLEETPWVMAAENEATQRKNIGLLFDLNRMSAEKVRALDKIKNRQLPSGAWGWFEGGYENEYMTTHLVEGFGRMKRMGLAVAETDEMMKNAVSFLDKKAIERYQTLEKMVKEGKAKWEENHLGYDAVEYLHARSYFDFPKSELSEKVIGYYISQVEKYWAKQAAVYTHAQMSDILFRDKKTDAAKMIANSIRERAVEDPERGMYWKANWGWENYELPIETQSQLIETFQEVLGDTKSIDEMRLWLLKNKQTNAWKTTKASAAAIYALILGGGTNWLDDDKTVEIKVGNFPIDIQPNEQEAGTGYFKKELPVASITPQSGKVSVTNPNKVTAWGAMYWQYFEDLDKIKDFKETPLKLTKQYFKVVNTDKGEQLVPIFAQKGTERTDKTLNMGDRVKVRVELRCDRAMSFVHLKDMRPAGLEPTNVLSSYKWQDGLGYYESTKDVATHFFFDYVPKGTFVFEYMLTAQQRGVFSTGISQIQSMYAPEFSSHSAGQILNIK